jgi:hypothetical protein
MRALAATIVILAGITTAQAQSTTLAGRPINPGGIADKSAPAAK